MVTALASLTLSCFLAAGTPAGSEESKASFPIGSVVFPKQPPVALRYETREVGKILFEAKVVRVVGQWLEVRTTNEVTGGRYLMGFVLENEVMSASQMVKQLDARLASNRDNPADFIYRAKAKQAVGDLKGAIADFSEAISRKSVAEFYNWRAVALLANKDFDLAMKDAAEASRLDPQQPYSLHTSANVWLAKEDYEKAGKDFTAALSIDPKFVPALNGRGYCQYARRKYTEALADYDAGLAIDPTYAPLYENRANVHADLGETAKAVADYNRAILLDSTLASAYHHRAMAEMKQQQYAAAKRDLQKSIELAATSGNHNTMAWLLATCADRKICDGKEAVRHAEAAIQLAGEGKHGELHDTYAAALAQAGDFARAEAEQQLALADDSLVGEERAKALARLELYRKRQPYVDRES